MNGLKIIWILSISLYIENFWNNLLKKKYFSDLLFLHYLNTVFSFLKVMFEIKNKKFYLRLQYKFNNQFIYYLVVLIYKS